MRNAIGTVSNVDQAGFGNRRAILPGRKLTVCGNVIAVIVLQKVTIGAWVACAGTAALDAAGVDAGAGAGTALRMLFNKSKHFGGRDAGRLQNLRGRSKKGRKVRDGSVRIWKRRNLSSSAWSRRRTPEGQGSAPSLSGNPPFSRGQALRLTLLGLVCGQTTMAHIALFARMHWPALKEPLGFHREHPPHATTISRTLAGVPYEQLQGDLTGWVGPRGGGPGTECLGGRQVGQVVRGRPRQSLGDGERAGPRP